MNDIENSLRIELRDKEYAETYADAFMNSCIATQIKVLREQRGLTQAALAEKIGTTQTGISRLENVDYSSWSIRNLARLARAFSVRLKVSFESYGTLPAEVLRFHREALQRVARENDPELADFASDEQADVTRDLKVLARVMIATSEVADIGRYRQAMFSGYTEDSLQSQRGGYQGLCG